jgi:hypothetical protein
MSVIDNSINIDRTAEEVFDYCSDMRTEMEWNPAAKEITLVTTEPLGQGSRFSGTWSGLGQTTIEVVDYARPSRWTARSVSAALPFRVVGTVVTLAPRMSRLEMRIEILPKGILKPLAPAIKLMMQHTAAANLVRIKEAVERLPTEQ